uniref:Uncharacterized protein n=1 Tax=Oryza sativa subsp. japonica TaxID=39947 RepID=Q8H477_ORYSJ|nr:hypothetical protein [Oryza sativa Japonica Group]
MRLAASGVGGHDDKHGRQYSEDISNPSRTFLILRSNPSRTFLIQRERVCAFVVFNIMGHLIICQF